MSRTVDATLIDISRSFNSWTRGQKRKACQRLVEVVTLNFINAWDMTELYSLGKGDWQFLSPPASQGTAPACDRTVAYRHKCYKSNAVNYLMFGHVMSLCHADFDPVLQVFPLSWQDHYSLPEAVKWVWLYKTAFYSGADRDQAIAFTVAGFIGGPPRVAPSTECAVDPGNVASERLLTWRWLPLHGQPDR